MKFLVLAFDAIGGWCWELRIQG